MSIQPPSNANRRNHDGIPVNIYADPGNSWIEMTTTQLDMLSKRLHLAPVDVLLHAWAGKNGAAVENGDARMRPHHAYFDEHSGQYRRVAELYHEAGIGIAPRVQETPSSPVRNFTKFEADAFLLGFAGRTIRLYGHDRSYVVRNVSEVIATEVLGPAPKLDVVMRPIGGYAFEVLHNGLPAIVSCETQGYLMSLDALAPDQSPSFKALMSESSPTILDNETEEKPSRSDPESDMEI